LCYRTQDTLKAEINKGKDPMNLAPLNAGFRQALAAFPWSSPMPWALNPCKTTNYPK
jgi:hypothetical protein